MLQRVAIAISLLHSPQLLIFDEATTALDVVTQGQILEEVVRLEKALNTKTAVMYAGQMMEIGQTRDVLKRPMHPYTQGLLHSFPTLTGERKTLESIPGSLPDLSVEHAGCVFAPRCPFATDRCHAKRPAARQMEDGRTVACWRYGGESDG